MSAPATTTAPRPALSPEAETAVLTHVTVAELDRCRRRLKTANPTTEQAKSAVQTARALLREAAQAELDMLKQINATEGDKQ